MKKEKRSKVIHCRVTEEEHATITAKAEQAGQTLTKYVIQSALCDADGL